MKFIILLLNILYINSVFSGTYKVEAYMDTTISGVAFDMLKSVDMVSDDMTWVSSGMCGKKQPMPVGMGGPAIRCKVNIGGR